MSNVEGECLYSGQDLEVMVAIAPSGRLGLEVNAALATHPQEPEVVAGLRDLLTNFLVDNGYE